MTVFRVLTLILIIVGVLCYVLLILIRMGYSLKDKKCIIIINAFQKILDESNQKLNKIWDDKRREFCNRSTEPWLQDNDTEMHSAHNKGKSVVAERFTRTLKNKVYKYVTSVTKNVYIKYISKHK